MSGDDVYAPPRTVTDLNDFEDSEVRYHVQKAGGRRERLFTVIGRRTHGGS